MSDVEEDSIQTSRFDDATKIQIQAVYGNRCALCLNKLVEEGSQCTDILDPSEEGASQVAICSQLDIIPRDYRRQSLQNGMILCGNCHQLFIHNYIALCPPKEILEYLVNYVKDTPAGKQMPLYQVFRELASLNPQGIPDRSAILPYIGLYTTVCLKPAQLQGVTLPSTFFPPLSIVHNGKWEIAPHWTVPTAPNAGHIFDSLAVNGLDQCPSPGFIPLHPDDPQYSQKQYWQLQNINFGGVLTAIILHGVLTPYTNDELKMVKVLFSLLTISKLGGVDTGQSDNPGPSCNAANAGPSGNPRPSGEGHREIEGSRGGRGKRGNKGRQKKAADEGSTRITRSSTKRMRI